MTENENSPENLRKFLESDDPAMRRMGLSMAKGSGVPEELNYYVLAIAKWDPEEENRKTAKELVDNHSESLLTEEERIEWEHIGDDDLWGSKLLAKIVKEAMNNFPENWRNIYIDLYRESGNMLGFWEALESFGDKDKKEIIVEICEDEYPECDTSDTHCTAVWSLSEMGNERDIETVFDSFRRAVYMEYEGIEDWMDALYTIVKRHKKGEGILIELIKECDDHFTLWYLIGNHFEDGKDVAKEAIKEMGMDPELDPW